MIPGEDNPMQVVYVAHPLAGDGSEDWGNREKNIYRYLCFVAWAMEQGYAVSSWIHHELLYQRGLKRPFNYWLDRDVLLLAKSDQVWLCGPPKVSSGMRVEESAAIGFGIPIRHDPEWDDPKWLPPLTPKLEYREEIDRQGIAEIKRLCEGLGDLGRAVAEERERAAKVCEAMVVGGRAWEHDQEVAAHALFAAAEAIRAGVKV